MNLTLNETEIEVALPKIEKGLNQYLWLQQRVSRLARGRLSDDEDFRRKFNHFYRVRRNQEWQDKYYNLLDNCQHKPVSFQTIFEALRSDVNRYEASFASKLLATLNPQMPVIDSVVLKKLGSRLPTATMKDRSSNICALHQAMCVCYADYLESDQGSYLVNRFHSIYPNTPVTDVKMLDFVLWQTRDK